MGEMKTVTCPKCSGQIRFEFRAVLSADREPEAAEALRNGTLFNVRCEGCGFESTIRYPILYTDMAHRVVIRCCGTDDEEVLRMTAEEAQKTAAAFGPDLRHRIVTNPDDLREKAEIFRAGLDDRYVEIMKPFVLEQLRAARPEMPSAFLRFRMTEGEETFTVFDAEGAPLGSFPFNRKAYEGGIVPNMPLGPEDNVLFVSPAWVAEYFARRTAAEHQKTDPAPEEAQ